MKEITPIKRHFKGRKEGKEKEIKTNISKTAQIIMTEKDKDENKHLKQSGELTDGRHEVTKQARDRIHTPKQT